MLSLRRSLPSVSALVTFEAAARLLSFTLAAAELGVTQAAVSRQIRALETDLGLRLFHRQHRRVELTRAGRLLSGSVTSGFDRIAETIGSLRHTHSAGTVSVGATLAFSHFWLLPRLTHFRRKHPATQMRVISQDEPFDMHLGDVQIGVRYGTPPFAGLRVLASLNDVIYPVCSPQFLRQAGVTDADQMLFSLPLLVTDWNDPGWASWGSWAEAAGYGRPELKVALRFTHYADTIYAAMNGEGVALGWDRLLSHQLGDGRLVRVGSACVRRNEGYHVVIPDDQDVPEAAAPLTTWLTEEFSQAAQHT